MRCYDPRPRFANAFGQEGEARRMDESSFASFSTREIEHWTKF
jgi:hypothetical protein